MFKYFDDLKGLTNSKGKTIKEGMLIRGTALFKLSSKEKKYITSLNLKTIIDLRHPEEIIHAKDEIFEGSKYIEISIIDNAISSITHVKTPKEQLASLRKMPSIQEVYRDMFTDNYSLSKIKEAIRTIALDDSLPCYYHCVTGKDRTGLITVILLHILDFDRKTIDTVYHKTYSIYIRHALALFFKTFIVSLSYKDAIKAKDMYTVKIEYVEIIYQTVKNNFGSMDQFIREYIGLSDLDIANFQEKVLK